MNDLSANEMTETVTARTMVKASSLLLITV